MPQTDYTGLARPTQLVGTLASSAGAGTVVTLLSGTGYPSGGLGIPFVLCFDPDSPNEEKILFSTRSGQACTIAQRGYDDTSAVTHTGCVVKHTADATVLRSTSAHMFDVARDDHTQYVKVNGTRIMTGALGIALPTDGTSLSMGRGAASYGSGSLVIGRDSPGKPQSLVFSGGPTRDIVIGRYPSDDSLLFSSWDGSNLVHRMSLNATSGNLLVAGDTNSLGRGAMGATGTYVNVGHYDDTVGIVAAAGTQADVNLIMQGKGNGAVQMRVGGDPSRYLSVASTGAIFSFAGAAALTVSSVGDVTIGTAANGTLNLPNLGNNSSSASDGTNFLPVNPRGFLSVVVAGSLVKIPYYNP